MTKTHISVIVAVVLWVMSMLVLGAFLWYVLSSFAVLLELIACGLETAPSTT